MPAWPAVSRREPGPLFASYVDGCGLVLGPEIDSSADGSSLRTVLWLFFLSLLSQDVLLILGS